LHWQLTETCLYWSIKKSNIIDKIT